MNPADHPIMRSASPGTPGRWPHTNRPVIPRPDDANQERAPRRSVVITGASRGLGAALFAELHRHGERIMVLGRQFDTAQRRAANRDPARVVLHHTDLRDPATLPSDRAYAAFLDGTAPHSEVLLVHNAATIEPIGLIGTLDGAAIDAAVQVNLVAPMRLTNTLLAVARRHRASLRIVYVASSAAHRLYPGWATYCATKAAAETFMRCAAQSSDPPCKVDIVDPGAMDTDMQRRLREQGAGLPGHDRMMQRHAAAQLADPVTVAGQIIADLFASPAPAD